MSNVFYVFLQAIILLIVFMMLLFFFLGHTSTTLSANTLNQAVMESAQYSRDDGMRVNRGEYVINPEKFCQRLDQYHINDLNGMSSANSNFKNTRTAKNDVLAVRFLRDDGHNDKTGSANAKGWMNAVHYSKLSSKPIPIRMVQVQAIPNTKFNYKAFGKKKTYQPNNWDNASRLGFTKKYSSTYAVEQNDLNSDDTHSNSKAFKGNPQDPVKDPFTYNYRKHDHGSVDLSDSALTGEQGQQKGTSPSAAPKSGLENGEM